MSRRPLLVVFSVFLLQVILAIGYDISINGHPWSFPLDDSWIHMTFGRNLANGLKFGVNPGESSAGSTSPVWSIWLGIIHFLFQGFGLRTVIAVVKVSGIVLMLSAVVGMMRILKKFLEMEHLQTVGGLLILLSYPFSWAALSGMEIPLTISASVWALAFQIDGCGGHGRGWQRRVAVVLWTLSAIIRPENLVFVALMIPIMSRREYSPSESVHSPKKAVQGFFQNFSINWKGIFSLSAWAVPVLLLNSGFYFYLSGNLFPNTLYAKMTGRAIPLIISEGAYDKLLSAIWESPIKDLSETFLFIAGENPLMILFLVIAPLIMLRGGTFSGEQLAPHPRLTTFFAWAGLPLVAILTGLIAGPEHYTLFHGRYLAHTLFLSAIVSVVVSGRAWAICGKPIWVALPLFFGAFLCIEPQVDMISRYGMENRNINHLQVTMGRWFGEQWKSDVSIAVNDIGAISYFGKKKIIDLEGLVTPQAIQAKRMGKINEFVEKVQPDLLLIFPYWYPEILKDQQKFKPVLKRSIEKNITGGGEELVLFTMPWSRHLPPFFPPMASQEFPEKVPVPAANPGM